MYCAFTYVRVIMHFGLWFMNKISSGRTLGMGMHWYVCYLIMEEVNAIVLLE